MNEGWTPERQKALMDKCIEQNASYGYDCPCFVEEVMKKYQAMSTSSDEVVMKMGFSRMRWTYAHVV